MYLANADRDKPVLTRAVRTKFCSAVVTRLEDFGIIQPSSHNREPEKRTRHQVVPDQAPVDTSVPERYSGLAEPAGAILAGRRFTRPFHISNSAFLSALWKCRKSHYWVIPT